MEENFDIVKLIEKNPITRLSQNYQNNFINKIKKHFTEHQQQLFVSSFFCHLNHDSKYDFIIDFDNIWKWVGFTRKDNAKVLLNKYFVENIDFKIVFLQSQENLKKNTNKKNKGGRPEEQILLTINTFKKFCLKAGTKRADEIHDYYIKLEELLHETLNEETDELRNQLKIKEDAHKMELKKEKNNTLIKFQKNRKCVYLCEIKENKLIKIGSSEQVEGRNKSLSCEYKSDLNYLDIFECENFREAEKNILSDPIIIENLYKQEIKPNGKTSREVVELSDKFTYDQLVKIVKKHVNEVQNSLLSSVQLLEKQKMDIEMMKMEIEKEKNDREFLLELLKYNKGSETINKVMGEVMPDVLKKSMAFIDKEKIKETLEEKMEEDAVEQIKKKIDKEVKKIIKEKPIEDKKIINPNNNLLLNVNRNLRKPQGRKIRKIDPNDITKVITVYDCMSYLMRSPENERFKKACLEKALNHNLIYQGYRWNYVEEGEDPYVSNAKPTKKSKYSQISDVVLQLNETRTKIIESFSTKKMLRKKIGVSMEKLNKIIQNQDKFNNYYYIYCSDCPKQLLDKFNGSTTRIVNAANSLGPIKRIDPITKSEVIFNTFEEIDIKLGFRRTTIKKAIANKSMWGGFIWEYCGKNEIEK